MQLLWPTMAAVPSFGLRRLPSRPWLHSLCSTGRPAPSPRSISIHSSLSSVEDTEDSPLDTTTGKPNGSASSNINNDKAKKSFYPKRGQTLELVCESLAFKGKGVCKVADTGFVVMCDRALPGERFIGVVTRKKDNYAEVLCVFPLSFTRKS